MDKINEWSGGLACLSALLQISAPNLQKEFYKKFKFV
jgi:hypothetical protein